MPRAILVIDGRDRRAAAYIPADGYRVRAYGASLTPGPEAVRATGLEAVLPREELLAFLQRLREATGRPDLAVQNLDPIVDRLRVVKSAREIAIMREAAGITGLGILAAMREAEPGMYEYELQAAAEYVFKKHGAQGPAYFALVATGPNTVYSHYHKGTRKLADGDLVQFDCAPDYKYYVSDVTRVFPANGRFTPLQREFYTIYLRLYPTALARASAGSRRAVRHTRRQPRPSVPSCARLFFARLRYLVSSW